LSSGARVFVSCPLLPEDEVMALAPEIDRLGFDGLAIGDHVFMPDTRNETYPTTYKGDKKWFKLDTPWPDPLILAGAIGQVAPRITILTSIYLLPLRHPLFAAKAAATVSRLTHGRLMLGIGVGWQREEFETLGVEFDKRGAITSESIRALRKLWRDNSVEHHGRHFSFGPLIFEPKPPPIPIIIGGSSDAAMRRAARLGDGYILPGISPDKVTPDSELERHSEALGRLHAALAGEGRDGAGFHVIVPCLDMDAEAVCSLLELGANAITVMPWPYPAVQPLSVEGKLEYLERYAQEELPAIRRQSVAA
jgi:probable F420-dependent oxidoreductase